MDTEKYHPKDMLKQDDGSEFVEAMVKETKINQRRNNWEVCPRTDVPAGMKIIVSIWEFKRRYIPNDQLLKHETMLNAHGSQHQWCKNYWEHARLWLTRHRHDSY